jgi:hypothetical protein
MKRPAAPTRSGSRTSGARHGPSAYQLTKLALQKSEKELKNKTKELASLKELSRSQTIELVAEKGLREEAENKLDDERERRHILVEAGVHTRLRMMGVTNPF